MEGKRGELYRSIKESDMDDRGLRITMGQGSCIRKGAAQAISAAAKPQVIALSRTKFMVEVFSIPFTICSSHIPPSWLSIVGLASTLLGRFKRHGLIDSVNGAGALLTGKVVLQNDLSALDAESLGDLGREIFLSGALYSQSMTDTPVLDQLEPAVDDPSGDDVGIVSGHILGCFAQRLPEKGVRQQVTASFNAEIGALFRAHFATRHGGEEVHIGGLQSLDSAVQWIVYERARMMTRMLKQMAAEDDILQLELGEGERPHAHRLNVVASDEGMPYLNTFYEATHLEDEFFGLALRGALDGLEQDTILKPGLMN